MTLDFNGLKRYSLYQKTAGPAERGSLMIDTSISNFMSQDTFFRFMKVRYAGRLEYALKELSG